VLLPAPAVGMTGEQVYDMSRQHRRVNLPNAVLAR
jgi:hypothetical protein